jgi:FMN phosphatase YigB (HAD superfamily)
VTALDAVPAVLRRNPIARRIGRRLAANNRRRALDTSPFFDAQWYLDRYPDVAAAGIDASTHFLAHGESEGRDPGPNFDTDGYIWLNPDARGHALTHYHRTLQAARLESNALFPTEVIDTRTPAIRDGWIDIDWFAGQHPDRDDRVHPWLSYRQHGGDPSAVFDHRRYLDEMPAGQRTRNPVEFWLSGEAPAELLPHVVSQADPNGRPLLAHQVKHRSDLVDISVVVMVHAFYPDVLGGLIAPLKHLPTPPTLLVSVVDHDAAIAVHATIDEVLGREQLRTIKVVPNRGRNFAPLLSSFTNELRSHEIVLHLHTKKSLYTGAERTGWREHLGHSLLRSPAAVDAILSLLVSDHDIGIVQPPIWDTMPAWAHHWLGNEHHGCELYERMGVTDRTARGPVTYPVGGMFWARVDALAPLLDLELASTDFERELGQADRTLAHAIERALPAAASVAGLHTVEADLDQGQWRLDWGRSLAPEFGRVDLSGLERSLATAQLVSVDLFDTLLLRPTLDPARLHDVIAMQFDTATGTSDGSRLVAARIAAERTMRATDPAPGDVGLEQIISHASAQSPDDAAAFTLLDQLERELETRSAIGRTWLIDALRSHRATAAAPPRFIIMSDTTLAIDAIVALLEQIGAADIFDDIYVSSERQARKDSGTMWNLVQAAEQPVTGSWLHIGDNAFSDIQQAADRGLAWFHVPAPAAVVEAAALPGCHQPDPGSRTGTELVAGHGLAALAARQRPGQATNLEAFGYGVLGPLTFTFVRWLVDEAARRGIDRLLFTARDGELAHRMFTQMSDELPNAPRADYFAMSRRVALGLAQHDGPHLDAMFNAGEYQGTVGGLLHTRLGVQLPNASRGVAETITSLPADHDALIELLAPHGDAIRSHGLAELAGFKRYLASLGVSEHEHLGLVDLGYGGTAQLALTGSMANRLTGFYWVTSPAAQRLGDAALNCFGSDVQFDGCNLIYQNNLVFEAICSADHGQVAFFDPAGRPVYEPGTEVDPDRMAQIRRAQDAALRFAHDHVERFGSAAAMLPVDGRSVHDAFQRAMGTLYTSPRLTFQHLVSDDVFCGRDRSVLDSFV